jgi:hypothetical protein
MGTTLTGTTPQDTYDSLIKVTDNGPLSGTAKYLSDGLGNDSILALSTARVGLGTNVPSAMLTLNATEPFIRIERTGVPTWQIQNNTLVVDAGFSINNLTNAGTPFFINGTTNNVGIGTGAPAQRLDIAAGALKADRLNSDLTCNDSEGLVYVRTNNISTIDGLRYASRSHRFVSHANSVYATIDSDGLKFGSDTAAANALDDYEEGTFTAVLNPATSGSFTLNSTFNTWGYTKIGRQVTIKGLALVSSVASPVGTEVYISGLPFTILNSNTARGSAAVTYLDQSAGTWSAVPSKHSINNTFLDIQIAASTIAANDEFYVTLTYFTA